MIRLVALLSRHDAKPAARAPATPVDAYDPGNDLEAMKVMDPMGYAVRQLPLVSPDGRHVAIDLGYGHAYAWYGVGGKLEDKIVLIDEATADGAPGHEPDPTKLAALAARVKDKLAGYVPFPTHPEATLGTTQLGATKLELRCTPTPTPGWTTTFADPQRPALLRRRFQARRRGCLDEPPEWHVY